MPASKLTPAMLQYRNFKNQHQDAVLFFRMGDFYEMFYEDAKLAARALGLTLTSRNHGKASGEVPLAGVPHHAMEGYVARLIQMGHKVAICEQVEDPKKARGVVKRDVVQVVSPGTAISDSMLDGQRNNFLVSICKQEEAVGLAAVDLSTGDFSLCELPAGQHLDELVALGPAELLLAEGSDEEWLRDLQLALPRVTVSKAENWHYEFQSAYQTLVEQLKVKSLKGFDCDDLEVAIRAAGAALVYLRENQRGSIDHINRVTHRRRSDYMLLDATAQRNLDLLKNQQDGGRLGSLLGILDRTQTPMGARMLRQWLVAPLKDPQAIEDRLDAVTELLGARETRKRLAELMSETGDLERMMARVCCQRANGRDLVGLARSLNLIPQTRQLIEASESRLLQSLVNEESMPETIPLVELLQKALVDEPPATIAGGGLIRDGYDDRVDELRRVSAGGKNWIAQLQADERERTGIGSLKVGFNQVFGYYLEISKANLDRAPEEYVRKQTLTNAERFITPDLKEYEEKVLGAEQRLCEMENGLFLELRQQTASWALPVQQVARSIAYLDVLCSLSAAAQSGDYVRPLIERGSRIQIEGGRHPVVEEQLQAGRFVPNDVSMDRDRDQILLVTGPNMAGKSTILRQTGLIVLMAQMGSFVPASAARIGVVDRIFTRVGAADDLVRGESTFMVEMNEAASILNNVTSQSLVLIDELGRGTSTYDGLSIAWAMLEFLHTSQARARTLFATHYHELTNLEDSLPRIRNYNVLVREEEENVIFLHRMERGACDRSYGIHVAQMAGMPVDVVARANEILSQLEKGGGQGEITSAESPQIPRSGSSQLQLFGEGGNSALESMAEELQGLDLSQMKPIEALVKLNEWKESIEGKTSGSD